MGKKSKRAVIKVIVLLAVIFTVVFGVLVMLQMSGMDVPLFSGFGQEMHYAQVKGNVQTVSIHIEPKKYAPVAVQRGIPVRFVIKADSSDLNSCNNTLIIPKYGIEKVLEPGENIIEFTPQETGNISYSCKMGMVKSKIKVVDDVAMN